MATAPVRIEPAVPGDIPHLVALLAELFRIEQDFSPEPNRQEKGLRLLLQHPDRATILVARDASGLLIGMISAQLVFSTAEGAPSAWIEDLIVLAAHRARGVGRDLLDAALRWARSKGATRAQLLADLDNQPARRFYEHLAWAPTRLNAWRAALR